MSQLDQFLNYLTALNESTIQLTKQDYQKICAIRDRVTELAARVPQQQIIEKPKQVQIKETTKKPSYQKINESAILKFEQYTIKK